MNEDATHKVYEKDFKTVSSVYHNNIIEVRDQELKKILSTLKTKKLQVLTNLEDLL